MIRGCLSWFMLVHIFINTSFADQMYGTVNRPTINGVAYDVNKPYIQPNSGYVKQESIESNSDIVKSNKLESNSQSPHVQINSLSSDSWASDVRVENALKHAAMDGKLNYVLQQAAQKNAPLSVAIVPIVESNYNKNALSNKGAAGAWQIMPDTANDYGLKSSERFNFEASTNVAIDMLNNLHKQFGNWALALAAYNCGSKCVINALNKNPRAKDIDDLDIPRETKDYVHSIVKINQVIAGLDSINKH